MTTSSENYPFADLSLARRLEKTEAHGNVEFVEARAKAFPDSGAEWLEVAGTYAMFDGESSPITQTFGLGMFQPITGSDLDTLETFFNERRADVFHEVCPLSDPSTLSLLNERGYRPIEFSSVLDRPIARGFHLQDSRNEKIQVRLIEEGEEELWAETASRGWGESGDLVDFLRELGQVNAHSDSLSFLAELDGQAIATGAMTICEGVGLLAGASTVPEARRQGAQLALLDARLRYAAEHDCDIAMMAAQPGSGSQRNAERHGFRIAYTRVKWHLPR
jgi:hypothetical protein